MMDSEMDTIILDSTGTFFVLCGSMTAFPIFPIEKCVN